MLRLKRSCSLTVTTITVRGRGCSRSAQGVQFARSIPRIGSVQRD